MCWVEGAWREFLKKRNQYAISVVCTVVFYMSPPRLILTVCAWDRVLWSSMQGWIWASPCISVTRRKTLYPEEVRTSRQSDQEEARSWKIGTWSPARLSWLVALWKSHSAEFKRQQAPLPHTEFFPIVLGGTDEDLKRGLEKTGGFVQVTQRGTRIENWACLPLKPVPFTIPSYSKRKTLLTKSAKGLVWW